MTETRRDRKLRRMKITGKCGMKRLKGIWFFSTILGLVIGGVGVFGAIATTSFVAGLIAIIVGYGVYCISYYFLCRLFEPDIARHVTKDEAKFDKNRGIHEFRTTFSESHSVKKNIYIRRYVEARSASNLLIAGIIFILLFIALAMWLR